MFSGAVVSTLGLVVVVAAVAGGIYVLRTPDTQISAERKKYSLHAIGILLYGIVSYLLLRGMVPETGALAGAFIGTVILAMFSYLLWGADGADGRTALTSIVYFLGVAIALLGFTGALGAALYKTRHGFEVIGAFVEFHNATADEIDNALDERALEQGRMTEDEYKSRTEERQKKAEERRQKYEEERKKRGGGR